MRPSSSPDTTSSTHSPDSRSDGIFLLMEFVDQLNRTILIPEKPIRIVSLVPSQTEILHALGLDKETVGITKFCVHPEEWFRTKTRIGGTKTLDIEKIKALQPDLIIGNKEENVREQIEQLYDVAPVWMSDIYTLEDALDMIREVGRITQKTNEAANLLARINDGFAGIERPSSRRKTAYFIWNDPYMVAGNNTFINDMLKRCGLDNIFRLFHDRYPVTSIEQLQSLGVELILLSSEPFPFKDKHVRILQESLPYAEIKLVDGQLFSWYGPRLIQAAAYFRDIVNNR